jgi:phage regulator Rha-like protein
MTDLMCLPSNSGSTVSSVTLADALGVRHAELLRSIRRMLQACPESITRRHVASSERETRRGKTPCFELTAKGILLFVTYVQAEIDKFNKEKD